MLKNFKFLSKNFALKAHRKQKLCRTINFTTDFYTNIILIQKEEVKNLLKKTNFHLDPKFLSNAYKINRLYEDDQEIYDLIQEKVIECAENGGIKTKSIYFDLFETFFENLKNNPDHPFSKQLLHTIEKQSYLFTDEEKDEMKKLLITKKSELIKNKESEENNNSDENYSDEETEKKKTKKSENIIEFDEKLKIKKNQKIEEFEKSQIKTNANILNSEEHGGIFLKKNLQKLKLKLKDENIQLFLDEGKNKITLKSKHFKSKIKLYGMNDNSTESVLKSFEVIEKNSPSIIIFQKRPLHFSEIYSNSKSSMDNFDSDDEPEENSSNNNSKLNISKNSQYISLLQRREILKYSKNILEHKKSKFKINSVERLVYEEVDSFKTISFVQSIILKIKNNLNSNPYMKIIFSDLPMYKEIEFILNNVMDFKKNNSNPKDFFRYMKLNLLFEKYLWLVEKCGFKCPACDPSIKFEMGHLKNENLIVDNYLPSLMNLDHVKVKNISEQILKSIKLNDHKDNTIIAFVEENYFYLTLERLIYDINEKCEGRDMESIENIFTKKSENVSNVFEEFNHDPGDWNKLIDNYEGDKKEIFNKLAVALNVYNFKGDAIEKSIQEFSNLKDVNKAHLKDLCKLYEERLNYVEEINLWTGKKYDYRCYPNEILINKFLDDDK